MIEVRNLHVVTEYLISIITLRENVALAIVPYRGRCVPL